MSVRITTPDDVALFDSVTGLPILTETFGSADEAEAFIAYAEKESTGLRGLGWAELRYLRLRQDRIHFTSMKED